MNPYREAERRQARHRWAAQPWEAAWPWLAPLLLGALGAPICRPVLLWFLERPPELFAEGVAGLALRLGMALCGAGILVVHARVLRGRERRILDPHPIEPGALVAALGPRLLRDTAGLAAGACALMLPLAQRSPGAFAAAAAVTIGGWCLGVVLGFAAQLGAVEAARDPRCAALLEALRGDAPRMQAALIWAPGLGLAAGAAALVPASRSLVQLLGGRPLALAGLLLPIALAALGWVAVPRLARRSWFAATAVLAEVDAAWAQLADREEERRVYLDWAARWAPPRLRPHLLRSLRAGWRARRAWILGAWGLGLLAALAGFSSAPDAPARAMLVASFAVALIAALGILLETGDPPWLGPALGLGAGHRALSRALAVFAWLQGAILPPTAAVLLRRGAEALPLLGALEALALSCSAAAAALGLLGRRAWYAWPALAVTAWILANRSLP